MDMFTGGWHFVLVVLARYPPPCASLVVLTKCKVLLERFVLVVLTEYPPPPSAWCRLCYLDVRPCQTPRVRRVNKMYASAERLVWVVLAKCSHHDSNLYLTTIIRYVYVTGTPSTLDRMASSVSQITVFSVEDNGDPRPLGDSSFPPIGHVNSESPSHSHHNHDFLPKFLPLPTPRLKNSRKSSDIPGSPA